MSTSTIQIVNVSNREATVYLYGDIGWEVDAGEFVRELADLDVDVIKLRVNSPGGDAYQGVAIMNALKTHEARVEAVVEGMAFSSASFIVAGGADHVVIHPAAEMMVHDAIIGSYGNAEELQRAIDRLDRMSDSIAQIYADRAGGTPEDWREAMKAETWFTAQEAVDAGLADEVWSPDEAEKPPMESVAASATKYSIMNHFRGRQVAPPAVLFNNHAQQGEEGNHMDFKNIVAHKLGVKSEDLTEEQLINALDEALSERAEEPKVPETPQEPKVPETPQEAEKVSSPVSQEGVVTLDLATFEELRRTAAAGRELAEQRADEALVAEVDNWVAEGRISNAIRNKALEAIRKDADAARATFGSNPVNTIPRRELGTSRVEEAPEEESSTTALRHASSGMANSTKPKSKLNSGTGSNSDSDKVYNAPYRGFAAAPKHRSNS